VTRHDDRIAGLVGLTRRLIAHLSSENELLESRRPRELGDRLEEKARLSAALGAGMAALKSDKRLLDSANPADLAELKDATGRLQAVLAVHQRKLAAVKSVTESIVHAIGTEIARQNPPVNQYDENATVGPVARNWHIARPTALAINQVV